jgi:hypothetical protein
MVKVNDRNHHTNFQISLPEAKSVAKNKKTAIGK